MECNIKQNIIAQSSVEVEIRTVSQYQRSVMDEGHTWWPKDKVWEPNEAILWMILLLVLHTTPMQHDRTKQRDKHTLLKRSYPTSFRDSNWMMYLSRDFPRKIPRTY